MSDDRAPGAAADSYDDDRGGDPACWLDRVCAACGRFVESGDACPVCGATLDR